MRLSQALFETTHKHMFKHVFSKTGASFNLLFKYTHVLGKQRFTKYTIPVHTPSNIFMKKFFQLFPF